MTDRKIIDGIIEDTRRYDVPAEIDYTDLCKKNYPDDLFLLEGCRSQRERENRYAVIASMNTAMRRNA